VAPHRRLRLAGTCNAPSEVTARGLAEAQERQVLAARPGGRSQQGHGVACTRKPRWRSGSWARGHRWGLFELLPIFNPRPGRRAGAAGLEFVNVHGFGEHGLKETAHSADPRANVSERLVPRPGTGPLALSNDDVGLALDSPTEWVAFDVRCVVCRRGSEQVGSRETGPAAARVRCHAPRTSGSRG